MNSDLLMRNAILGHLKEEIGKIAEEESEKALVAVRRRIDELIAATALDVSSAYDVHLNSTRLDIWINGTQTATEVAAEVGK